MNIKALLLHNTIAHLIMLTIMCVASAYSIADPSSKTTMSTSKKMLVVYFSRTGNTEQVAKQIHSLVGGDIFEVRIKTPYPESYDATTVQAKKEKEDKYTPPLVANMTNLSSYDVIFLGYPIWWGSIPAPIRTFLTGNNFSGKTIIPFCTHEGSGQAQSITDIKEVAPDATILEPFVIQGKKASSAQNAVKAWLIKLGLFNSSLK